MKLVDIPLGPRANHWEVPVELFLHIPNIPKSDIYTHPKSQIECFRCFADWTPKVLVQPTNSQLRSQQLLPEAPA